MFSVALLLVATSTCQALTLNPSALDAALWKQNAVSKIATIEAVFKAVLSGAMARDEYPTLKDFNTASIEGDRNKRKFAEMAKSVFLFDESLLNDVTEIIWVIASDRGMLFSSPEDMASLGALSDAAIVKVKLEGYKDNKFYSLALSSMKEGRIISMENNVPVVWLMPKVSQTQALIEQTAKIINAMQGAMQ